MSVRFRSREGLREERPFFCLSISPWRDALLDKLFDIFYSFHSSILGFNEASHMVKLQIISVAIYAIVVMAAGVVIGIAGLSFAAFILFSPSASRAASPWCVPVCFVVAIFGFGGIVRGRRIIRGEASDGQD
jgi:hypothetical protein